MDHPAKTVLVCQMAVLKLINVESVTGIVAPALTAKGYQMEEILLMHAEPVVAQRPVRLSVRR
jgi:hypothetical protein